MIDFLIICNLRICFLFVVLRKAGFYFDTLRMLIICLILFFSVNFNYWAEFDYLQLFLCEIDRNTMPY